ncbi:MAG TPA: hypothetical protein VH394_27935, partial [Thermoanaerobaculia bacterium]|nr:hypothetical protein [Thermoanaerobaculia bacterium]
LEIASIAHPEQPGPPPSKREVLVAVLRLRRIATVWQRLSEIRQRIAWGREVVARVDRDYIVELQPKDAHLECRYLVKHRRHALFGFPPQPVEPVRWALEPPIKRLLQAVGTRFPALDTTEMVETILKDLAKRMLPSDIVLWDLIFSSSEEGETAKCLLHAYFLRYIISYTMPTSFDIKGKHIQRWPLPEILDILVSSSGVSPQRVAEIMPWVTWAPLDKRGRFMPLDLEKTPYVDLGDASLGIILVTGLQLNPFAETRRILASMNRISSVVGESYELYIRSLLADAGFDVLGHSAKVTENGRLVTDIDILAFKDGVVVVVQAKHIVEPDSHHAAWKAAKEIAKGVRQCVVARRALRNEPNQLLKWFPDVRTAVPMELFCLVVSPSIAFGSELYWPVAVVDDNYLQHVVHIGVARKYDLGSNEVIETRQLYDGDHPSGPVFRDLMMTPEFLRYYRGNETTLESTVHRIGFLQFRRLDAVDLQPGER